ncbi:cyclic pyranopterin monophosphate synthase MoaC [Haloglomus salinum]|jgi:cyclic pyranopterin phosphate synthase|uniref:cyclic pyranopterin monophosphate synthase MoaC n=1 Tax=Haloglomus salinum TaxID=2962673 RepID=UPI002576E5B5|nr:cyclic pyranopterin monophosphate synthase MoaC [Haloglomus salinum]
MSDDSPQDHNDPDGPDGDPEVTTHEDGDGLTHVEDGDVQMVDVGDKPDTARRAVARGAIHLQPSTVEAIRADEVGKGDVLATARVGAVQAVKHTWETIPMCHQIPITNVETGFDVHEERVDLEVAVETTGKTGCEMEALEGVTTGLNVVWDMVKAVEKDEDGQYPDTRIDDVRVVTKEKRPLDREE